MNKIDFIYLTEKITETHYFFQKKVVRQVNMGLSLRNWLLGYYLVEYEQNGTDRAVYGTQLYKKICLQLKEIGIGSIRERHLYLCKDFYMAYSDILRTVSAKSEYPFELTTQPTIYFKRDVLAPNVEFLLSSLTFSHFIELLKTDTPLQRAFYEIECLNNNWSVRDLRRAIDSLLFERTSLSQDKASIVQAHAQTIQPLAVQLLRDPYIFEFLELPESQQFSESQLEAAIIDRLQTFLIEIGKGFCFEARQKRITFDNTHYKIDLVFYHRILKCHILIDLKIGEFTHADAGQMNFYLNYFREEEMMEGDNLPIGIILCSNKNDTLVKYATGNLPQQIFVSKYLINLPKEEEIRKFIVDRK